MQNKETKQTAMVFLNILLICDAESVARANACYGVWRSVPLLRQNTTHSVYKFLSFFKN
jgi:hypothetical protein